MKHRSNTDLRATLPARWRFALTSVALAVGCLATASPSWALGLGRLAVQSALGETLRAEIEVTSMSAEEASSMNLRVASPDTYRAAGVEYNAVLTGAQVQVARRADGATVLRVTSDKAVLEPFVDIIIEASWATGRLVREYTLLFDPPSARLAQTPPPAVAPAVAAAPPPAPARAPAPPAAAPAPAPRVADPGSRAVAAAPAAPAPAGVDEYLVRSGDTLSRIAGRTQRPGVSLDQMLVSLFRANPLAFMGENMNRLKAGAVLSVPSAEAASQVSMQQAREIIVAQSSDFAAYRQRLAAGATADAERASARSAAGQVQTQVEDRKQAAAASPDKLTLSQGAVRPGAPESQASKDAERKDSGARLAELARNVDELKKLQGGAAPAPAAPAQTAPATVAATPPTPAPTAATPAPAPAPAATPPAPAPVAAAPKPPAVPPAGEPGWLDSLLENPLLLPAAGVLVALLAGFGLYRMRGNMRKTGGETSFLESRLQPDSFFGASGGQRVDTREAQSSQSSSSSMSYSLSQLDAIGDVDPVAEADVYLAYGRDLQAEEILKEALRSNPERMAIRAKLLEVYAKRRDAKGFELLATQVHNLTHGEGEDWAKAQELGRNIDPTNPLYQPGGQPEAVIGSSGQPVEPLSATTVNYRRAARPSTFQPAPDAALSSDVDLDLDLVQSTPPAPAPAPVPATPASAEPVQALAAAATLSAGPTAIDFDDDGQTRQVARPAEPPPPVPEVSTLDFDLGAPAGDVRPEAAPAAPASVEFADFGIGSEAPASTLPDEAADPLERKLELAEEFRQIGDLEGARDLLEEVVAKAEGSLRNKAQAMLDTL